MASYWHEVARHLLGLIQFLYRATVVDFAFNTQFRNFRYCLLLEGPCNQTHMLKREENAGFKISSYWKNSKHSVICIAYF